MQEDFAKTIEPIVSQIDVLDLLIYDKKHQELSHPKMTIILSHRLIRTELY